MFYGQFDFLLLFTKESQKQHKSNVLEKQVKREALFLLQQ